MTTCKTTQHLANFLWPLYMKTFLENMKRRAVSLRQRSFLHVRVVEQAANARLITWAVSTSTEIANSILRCATRYHLTEKVVLSICGDITRTDLTQQRRLFLRPSFLYIVRLGQSFSRSKSCCVIICRRLRLIELILLQQCQLAQHCSTPNDHNATR